MINQSSFDYAMVAADRSTISYPESTMRSGKAPAGAWQRAKSVGDDHGRARQNVV